MALSDLSVPEHSLPATLRSQVFPLLVSTSSFLDRALGLVQIRFGCLDHLFKKLLFSTLLEFLHEYSKGTLLGVPGEDAGCANKKAPR